jgi:hypothetical protein
LAVGVTAMEVGARERAKVVVALEVEKLLSPE